MHFRTIKLLAPCALAVWLGCATEDATFDGSGAAAATSEATSASSTAATGGAGGGAGGAAGSAAGGAPTGCTSSDDCAGDPGGGVCDTDTGLCVLCTPTEDICPAGQYCTTAHECIVGCTDESDCPGATVCDPDIHSCVNCAADTDCPVGSICKGAICTPGCSSMQPCQVGSTCCGATCFDLLDDINHCGTCDTVCEVPPNASPDCVNGACAMGACDQHWDDCNGDADDGCEHSLLADGACVCDPGSFELCYYGAPGTLGVGPCEAGSRVCNPDGNGWGPCVGQVLPSYEICANNIDEDCDGTADNAPDADGDGWSYCDGDCNPSSGVVNPGAFEVVGNGVDDDCDPASSDTTAATCTSALKLTGVTAQDLATAMELCQTTTANPPKPQKKWGVISAKYTLGSGANPSATQLNNMQDYQGAVEDRYGTAGNGNAPKAGPTYASLSTGRMRYTGQPGYVSPQTGTGFATANSCPSAYTVPNGGLPSSAGCNGACISAQTCNDSVVLRLEVRTPTNAQSFSYDFRFFSAEYPEWTCTSYNDFYLALLTSTEPSIPMDKNISFDSLGNPVSVNNGFFDACSPSGCYTCPLGTTALGGTGMEGSVGGGTNWLTTDAPIVPGEVVTLELMTFDVGDTIYDSLVLIDNFRWSLLPQTVGTHE